MPEQVSQSSVAVDTNAKGDATVTVKLYAAPYVPDTPARTVEYEALLLSRAVVETYTGTIRKLRLHHVNVAGGNEYGDEVSKQHRLSQEARFAATSAAATNPSA